MKPTLPRRIACLALMVVLVAVGCGDNTTPVASSEGQSSSSSLATTTTTSTPATTVITGSASTGPPLTSLPGTTSTTTATTTPSSSSDRTVTVDETANGRTITLHVGQHLVVHLHGEPQMLWAAPDTGDPMVLSRTGSSADPATGDSQAEFVAVAAGNTTVVATGDAPCRKATPPCMVPSRGFHLDIVVS